jgi:hypothetical protein
MFIYLLADHLALADDLYIKLLSARSKTSLVQDFLTKHFATSKVVSPFA